MDKNITTTPMFSSANIKRALMEPKVYAVLMQTKKGRLVHLGVHYSLDEAYEAGREYASSLFGTKPSEHIDIDLWASLDMEQMVEFLTEYVSIGTQKEKQKEAVPVTAHDHIEKMRETKNALMQSIISSGDPSALGEARGLLTKNDIKYVEERLAETAKK